MSSDLPSPLSASGVAMAHRPMPYTATLLSWLDMDELGPSSRLLLLTWLSDFVGPWGDRFGGHSRDLLVLHPGTAGLKDLLTHQGRPHTHRHGETHCVIDGEGVFGIFDTQGHEHTVFVQPGDFLHIPAEVEHRFGLTALQRIKTIRLCAEHSGWSSVYTPRAPTPLPVHAPHSP